MLVEDVNGIVVTPLGIVRSPRFHVADALDLGEAGLDSVVEHTETLGIVVTLVRVVVHVIVVVFVTNLDISDVEGFWMTVLGAHLAVMTRDWAVGVLKGTEALVNPRLQLIQWCATTMPNADVHHIERLSSEVLGKLQKFMEAKAVRRGITPVGIHVTRTSFYRANSPFPMIGILRLMVALHIATAREAHESRMKGLELLGQIDAAAILAAFVGWWEEAHHIKKDATGVLEGKVEDGLRVALSGYDVSLHLLPALTELDVDGGGTECVVALGGKAGEYRAGLAVKNLNPERQFILRPCHYVDAPISGIANAGTGDGAFDQQGMTLLLVEEVVADETDFAPLCLPMFGLLGIILKGAVPDELSIEAAIGSIVDVFIKDAIERGADFDALLRHIYLDIYLGLQVHEGKGQQTEDEFFFHFHGVLF